jgi:GAF domain-containing protein
MQAPLPANEKRRLEVLWSYDVLDTPPEQTLDDLTQLAATLCGTPVAMISLVDENRQWFKSRQGFDDTETARDISFCAHTILRQEVMVVPDARRDKRFAHSPLVKAKPHIRFYAGAPLITPDGFPLGTLCVIDHRPRRFLKRHRKALETLARVVMSCLEMRRRIQELSTVPIRQHAQAPV